jgi:hypothetical protein
MSSDSDDGVKFHRVVLMEKYIAAVANFNLAHAFAELESTREGQWALLNELKVDHGFIGNRVHGDATLMFVAYVTDIQYTDYILRFK